MAHQAPARGVMDGIRQDMQKAKEGAAYKPNGIGNAYSHNFLNQANFRNQARVYEAQQKQIEDAKKKEVAKAEFQAEQEFLKTLSYLSPEEQQRFKERQGVQFLYMKPPGADSMPAPAPVKSAVEGQTVGAASTAGAQPAEATAAEQQPQQRHSHGSGPKSHLKDMLGAVRALQNHEKWDVRHMGGIGRSPPRGTVEANAANQQIVIGSSDEDEAEPTGIPAEEREGRKRKASEERLAEAEEVLRRAGIDVDALRIGRAKKRNKKDKKEKKAKKKSHRDK